jgi:hypothetical protein
VPLVQAKASVPQVYINGNKTNMEVRILEYSYYVPLKDLFASTDVAWQIIYQKGAFKGFLIGVKDGKVILIRVNDPYPENGIVSYDYFNNMDKYLKTKNEKFINNWAIDKERYMKYTKKYKYFTSTKFNGKLYVPLETMNLLLGHKFKYNSNKNMFYITCPKMPEGYNKESLKRFFNLYDQLENPGGIKEKRAASAPNKTSKEESKKEMFEKYISKLWIPIVLFLSIIVFFYGIGLYRIAEQRGIGKPWFSFVPILNFYILGKLIKKESRTILTETVIILSILSVFGSSMQILTQCSFWQDAVQNNTFLYSAQVFYRDLFSPGSLAFTNITLGILIISMHYCLFKQYLEISEIANSIAIVFILPFFYKWLWLIYPVFMIWLSTKKLKNQEDNIMMLPQGEMNNCNDIFPLL